MRYPSTILEFISTYFPGSLVGVIGGFLTGLLTEPIKARMSTKRKMTELRDLLYREVARVCLGIDILEGIVREKRQIPTPLPAEESLQFLAFDMAFEKELPIIAEMQEALVFRSFRDRVKVALSNADTSEASASAVTALVNAKHTLEGAIDVKLVDKDQFTAAYNRAWKISLWGSFGGYHGAFKGLPDKAEILETMFPFEAVVSFNGDPTPRAITIVANRFRGILSSILRKSQSQETIKDALPARSIECDCVAGNIRIKCHIFGRNHSLLEKGRRCNVGLVPDYLSRDEARILRPQVTFGVELKREEIGTGEILRLPASLYDKAEASR